MDRHRTNHVETLIIGGGQSGLATGHQLKERGRPFLILDAEERIGDAWRNRWDSLRLFTPARYDSLPGMSFPAASWHYPTKDEVADYLQAYASRFELPIVGGAAVEHLSRRGHCFEATTAGQVYTANNVVLASGMFRTPRIPTFAGELDPGTDQLHSRDYHNPEQVQPGPVLVVGAGNSGAEIAKELVRTHPTYLAGRDPGQEPTRAGSLPDKFVTPLMWFAASHVLTVRSPIGRKAREHFLHPPSGIPLGRVRRKELVAAGVERVPRVAGIEAGRPLLDGAGTLDVNTVIWCTGLDIDLSWVDLTITLRDGYPENNRGQFPEQPGLYIVGLAFQTALSSALLGGAGRDAARIAAHIASKEHSPTTSTASRPVQV